MSALRDLRHRLEAFPARVALWLLSAMPAAVAVALGQRAGWLVYMLFRKRRRIAIDNISAAGICDTPEAVKKMALASFQTFTVMLVESFILRRDLTSENLREHVTLDCSEEGQRLLKTPGQPLIVSTGHIGNWEVAMHVGSLLRPMAVVYRPMSNPYLQEIVLGERLGQNVTLLSSQELNPFRFFRTLKKGNILVLMTDQHAVNQRVQVDFFGRPAWTIKTVSVMHFFTKAPLISVFCIRTGPLRYEVICSDPVQYEPTGDREVDALRVTQLLAAETEKVARQFPAQYMWGHRRWKP